MTKHSTPNGGYAEVVQMSQCANTGKFITTVNVKYGLIIHAEFLRHRQLSRGVKSNRAIPAKTIRNEVLTDPYVPMWFGRNQSGMVAKAQVKRPAIAKALWLGARYPAVFAHWAGEKLLGAHKEWINRLLSPWQWVRETITATEWDNLYALRIHPAAQNDIRVIVEAIYEAQSQAINNGDYMVLKGGIWHVPYISRFQTNNGTIYYQDNDGVLLTTDQAIIASAARCARSSYDNHDKSKALFANDLPLYNMLIEDDPKHASPIEHQCTPMKHSNQLRRTLSQMLMVDHTLANQDTKMWESGVTHTDRSGDFWSGNMKGWVQYRQLVSGHVCENYQPEGKE